MQNSKLLTEEQKSQILGVLSTGCDRQTGVDFAGCSLGDLRRAMCADAEFAITVRRTEAIVELEHMRRFQETAKDPKNWRLSAWWLERRSPERFGPRGPGVVTISQLKGVVAMLTDTLVKEVHDVSDRQRLASRLQSLSDELDQMLGDVLASRSRSSVEGSGLWLEADAAPPDDMEGEDEEWT